MNKLKYNINDTVYIADMSDIVEGIITEIHIVGTNISYKIKNKSKDYYIYNIPEEQVFSNKDDVKKFIRKRNLNDEINRVQSKASNYKEWVSNLDVAIKNYEACKTDICVKMQSNQTNGSDDVLLNITSTNSKMLLEYLRKYFNDVFKELENQIEELKKENE